MRRRVDMVFRKLTQMAPHRILLDVANVLRVIAGIPETMILESLLPDLHVRVEFLLRPEGEAPFDELDCPLQACQRRDEDMDMVGHDDEFMEKIGGASVVLMRV